MLFKIHSPNTAHLDFYAVPLSKAEARKLMDEFLKPLGYRRRRHSPAMEGNFLNGGVTQRYIYGIEKI